MRTTIPTNPRRQYSLIAGLDVTGMFIVGLSGLGAYGLMRMPWPLLLKIPVALIIVGFGAALGWGRWPLGEGGDPIGVWLARMVHFFFDESTPKRYLPPAAKPPTTKTTRTKEAHRG